MENISEQIFIIKIAWGIPIDILDIECVLCHVIGVQNENKNALYKSAMLDLFEERCIQKIMRRI